MKISPHFTTLLVIALLSLTSIGMVTSTLTHHQINGLVNNVFFTPHIFKEFRPAGTPSLATQASGATLPELEITVESKMTLIRNLGNGIFSSEFIPQSGKISLSGNTLIPFQPGTFNTRYNASTTSSGIIDYSLELKISFPKNTELSPITFNGLFNAQYNGRSAIESAGFTAPASFVLQSAGLGKIEVKGVTSSISINTLELQFTWKEGPNGCAFPTLTQQPINSTICESSPAMFSVAATGNGTLRYQWRKNDVTIPGATEPTLNLNAVSVSDAGTYEAIVADDCGVIRSVTAFLGVVRPGEFSVTSRLLASDATRNGGLGQRPIGSGDTIVAPAATGLYVFTRTGNSWNQETILKPDNQPRFSFGEFTFFDIAIDKNTIAVLYDGGVYIFVRLGTTWTQQANITGPLISSIALQGDVLVVGEGLRFDTDPVSKQGSAKIYRRTGQAWNLEATLTTNDVISYFGAKVALSGGKVAIAATNETVFGAANNILKPAGVGAVYIFEHNGTTWTQTAKINGKQNADQFGRVLLLDNDLIFILSLEQIITGQVGALYAYQNQGGTWVEQQRLGGDYNSFRRNIPQMSLSPTKLRVANQLFTRNAQGIDPTPKVLKFSEFNYSGSWSFLLGEEVIWGATGYDAGAGLTGAGAVFVTSQITCGANLAVITAHPQNQQVADQLPAGFRIAFEQSSAITGLQWQVSTNGGNTYTDITGATRAELAITPDSPLYKNNNRFRVIIISTGGRITSDAATLTISATLSGFTTTSSSGLPVAVNLGSNTSLVFSNVTQSGTTTVKAIPLSGVTLPGGATPPGGSLAFDVTTTATFTGPVTLTFNVPTVNDPAAFAQLRVYHGEGTPLQFADRTVLPPDSPAPNYVQRQISARVTTLSPFVIAGAQATNPDDNWDSRFTLPGINGRISNIAVSGSDVYVSGDFTSIGGVSANRVAKWNGSTWSALGSGINNGSVSAIAVSGTDVYVGGFFTSAGGVSANRIAKWNGSSWSALGSGIINDGSVNAIAISGTDIYVGGGFTNAGGVSANYIAKWNGSSWSALGSGVSGPVNALAISGNDLYAGSSSLTIGGSYITKWNGSSWATLGSGVDYNVYALAISGSNLYVGGAFTDAGSVNVNSVAKWNGSSWSALGSGVGGVNSYVGALAINSGNLYVGGFFASAGGKPSSNFARYSLQNTTNTAPTITAAPTLTRQQGNTGTVSQIATVNDAETAVGNLTVTATTIHTGITISNITNTNGTITTNIAATATATLGNNTVVLTVTDGGGLTATANLIINVTPASNTATGTNVTVTSNNTTVTFSNVTTAGNTTITPIAPATAGTLPNGYVLVNGSLAFEITTTAAFSGPITLTFNVPGVTDAAVFSTLRVLHGEGTPQALVDRTVLAPDTPAPNFATKQISARVTTLSPFVIAALTTPPPTGCAVTQLQQPTNYATADTPAAVAHGDFNGDGKPDLVTANYEANAISVLLNNGTGRFAPAVNYNAGGNPKAVTVGDLNGDSKLDLVVANLTSFDLSVFLGKGDGTFTTAPRVFGMNYPTSVALGDFNGDGKVDLVIANSGSFLTTVVYGSGDGTFRFGFEHFNFDGGMPYAVTAGDFNKDGKQDFAVAFNTKDAIGVYLNLPSGLTNNIQMFPARDQPIAIAAGDFDGDGTDDVAAANYGSNNVTVVTSLSTVTPIAVGSLPETLAVADLNGDAKKDLIVGNAGTNFVSLLTATSGGQFTRQDAVGVESPSAVAATDFNGDGKVDVIVADYWVNRITTYQGACGTTSALEAAPNLQTLRYVRSKYDGYPNVRNGNGRRGDTTRSRQR